MSATWYLTQKPEFLQTLRELPPKVLHQVVEKLNQLAEDPRPDGRNKVQLRHLRGRLHRLRCGDYRILYVFEKPYICLLAIRRRDDDTYEEHLDTAFPGDPPALLVHGAALADAQPSAPAAYWDRWLASPQADGRPLPAPITVELLTSLNVPAEYHARLLPLRTEEELLACPGVPDDYLLIVDHYLFETPLQQVMQQPDYLLERADDLLRYCEGELLGFLLKLSPEQQRYVLRGLGARGPILLKGGPGTGKSTIALYRVRALLEELRRQGRTEIRMLFTTYTNALVKSSEQLLRQLLGADVACVEVQTADHLIFHLLGGLGYSLHLIEGSEARALLQQALSTLREEDAAGGPGPLLAALRAVSLDYLYQELCQVIMARQLETEEQYLQAARPGRRVPLSRRQRRAVWAVYEQFTQLLQQRGLQTWQQVRALAERCAREGRIAPCYDAVIIDEAQDLDPAALRLLIRLCRDPEQLFITADANQSIYGSGFAWSEVHELLAVRGRTCVLQVDYRSTRQIGEAALSYLRYQPAGSLESELPERQYEHEGPVPAVRSVASGEEELDLLARFLRAAARDLRLSLGAAAVLCPTLKAGQRLAEGLQARGLPATFMRGQELDLQCPGVKVLTLKSAKGLEFPIVALAGFSGSGWYSSVHQAASEEEREELLAIDRRTIFVGMTRAMRALLVVLPAQRSSPLLEGFDCRYWNLKDGRSL
jgi:superfamily I DNA/RNA helicase/mRNA-degrading endonuclease RelE of RelBE toxin-antitoxin system